MLVQLWRIAVSISASLIMKNRAIGRLGCASTMMSQATSAGSRFSARPIASKFWPWKRCVGGQERIGEDDVAPAARGVDEVRPARRRPGGELALQPLAQRRIAQPREPRRHAVGPHPARHADVDAGAAGGIGIEIGGDVDAARTAPPRSRRPPAASAGPSPARTRPSNGRSRP